MHNPWSPGGTSVTSPSQTGSTVSGGDSERLRNEVESLRREMDQIREQTMYAPPPEYDPGDGGQEPSSGLVGGSPAGRVRGGRSLPPLPSDTKTRI
ncbi:hypothetical protein CPB85DRAFT_1326047 [Mucidula mucida]|nr:hypothetical protein CPB85DRAFT_1326047 [Mucidula mucida]